eukprot:scaffold7781_cov57-Phaeocystis_antarctica.AAC.6
MAHAWATALTQFAVRSLRQTNILPLYSNKQSPGKAQLVVHTTVLRSEQRDVALALGVHHGLEEAPHVRMVELAKLDHLAAHAAQRGPGPCNYSLHLGSRFHVGAASNRRMLGAG